MLICPAVVTCTARFCPVPGGTIQVMDVCAWEFTWHGLPPRVTVGFKPKSAPDKVMEFPDHASAGLIEFNCGAG